MARSDNKLVSIDQETHARLKSYAKETHRTLGGAIAGLLDEAEAARKPKQPVYRSNLFTGSVNPEQTDI